MRQLDIDIKDFCSSFPLREELYNSSFLITGATGLIGSTLVRCLLSLDCHIKITIPVRDKNKARALFGDEVIGLKIIQSDLIEYVNSLNEKFDFVIHCASPTSGQYIIEHPAETYVLLIDSTKSLLRYSYRYGVKSFVFLSSIEYYGQVFDDGFLAEDKIGFVDPASSRSAYPLGKRAAEYLCKAYALEYRVPVKIARLTQTFGAGVAPTDTRVFAQFARSIVAGENIVLHTTGESAKPYCYTTDCVSAILTILLKGKNGEPYNVANQETYISIYDLAVLLRDTYTPNSQIVIENHPEKGYAPISRLHLSSEKLLSLGWRPQYGLKEMFKRLINSILEWDTERK